MMTLCAGAVALSSGVVRADEARTFQQPFVWTGSTFGLHAIYGRGSATWYDGLLDPTPEGKVSLGGAAIGGALGMSYQFPVNIVVGAELSFARGFESKSACSVVGGATCQTNVDWYAVPSVRVGYAWDNVLLYGKVGYGLIDQVHQLRDAPTVNLSNARTLSFSPIYGVGVDYAVRSNLIAGLEYNHFVCDVKLNHFSDPKGVGVAGADIDMCLSDVRLKLGVKY